VSVHMPNYDGHIGEAPRPMTQAERRMILKYPAHQLADSRPPSQAPELEAKPTPPWIPV
jgi:hypothetical protein